jgi:protein-S-isoprenylcysteine O-methyltransferase Ste14
MAFKNIYIRITIRFVLNFFLMAFFLFVPAGTWLWLEGWLFIFIFLFSLLYMALWLYKHNPDLLEKRLSNKFPPKTWDKLFLVGFYSFIAIQYLTLGFDVVRFQWSTVPIWIKSIGFIGVIGSLYFIFLVLKENSFLAKIVEIQKGQTVVSSGPYQFVRHPMYAAGIVLCVCLSLSLGSLYSLIPAVFSIINLIIRTELEDRLLQKELKGYKEYTKKVQYKLIPGIW